MDARYSRLCLVPIGDSPTPPIHDLARDLQGVLGMSARIVTDRITLPEDAYDTRRGQHLAPRILGLLREARGRSDVLVLGVANSDLFAPGLSFVFGQADTVHGVAVISLCRLYPAFHARPHDVPTFRRRGAIEGVHETGHLLGVPHCADRHCVMYFSSTIADSDRKGPLFCSACRSLVDRAVAPAAALEGLAADGPDQ